MTEKPITLTCDDLQLEGLLYRGGPNGVVVTHPHPLYGGNMYNAVVEIIVQAFQEQNFSTLRFNYRGVGASQGSYDHGTGETRDTRQAMDYLAKIGIERYYLAGYSFGAWVNARLSLQESLDAEMVMVSPPVAFIDFEPRMSLPNLKLVVTGSRDEIAPEPLVRKSLADWNPAACFEVIPGADHFYSGCCDKLADALTAKIVSEF